jgi:hypothetical protein
VAEIKQNVDTGVKWGNHGSWTWNDAYGEGLQALESWSFDRIWVSFSTSGRNRKSYSRSGKGRVVSTGLHFCGREGSNAEVRHVEVLNVRCASA